MNIISLVLLAIALSVDGFFVGCSYGLRKTKLLPGSIGVIALLTAMLMGISMSVGSVLSRIIPNFVAQLIGGFILIVIGIWQLIQGWLNYICHENGIDEPEPILAKVHIRSLGVVIQILKTPDIADLDLSGDIDSKEALLLGLALGLDAFGAGFGAGMTGYSLIIVPSISITQILVLKFGLCVGNRYSTAGLEEKTFVIPGIILMALGVLKVLQ